ncbi:hypothetical protein D3C87_1395880 [compost metagenome]
MHAFTGRTIVRREQLSHLSSERSPAGTIFKGRFVWLSIRNNQFSLMIPRLLRKSPIVATSWDSSRLVSPETFLT